MLVLLSIVWGISWPLMKIALIEIPPFSMRTASAFFGAVTLIALTLILRHNFHIPTFKAWVHVVVASLLNVVGFSIFSAFAQISAATSRVTILAYTMPIWAALMARPILGERLTTSRTLALVLCVAGLTILIFPLATRGIPLGLMFALATGVSWAAGTVYLKWARIGADPMGVASWQLIVSFFVLGLFVPIFEGWSLHLSGASAAALFGLFFTGAAGMGLAYGLWFDIVRRLPMMTASLGVLSVPVVGVIGSVLILGDRPTLSDVAGFVLIFAASACVLLAPQPGPAPSTQA
jgi:drug/metabolite transporter (DMT)-like permease